MQQPTKVSTRAAFHKMTSHWNPQLVASVNSGSYEIKVARISREFVWHAHSDTDEVFHVLTGEMTLQFHEPGNPDAPEDVELGPGDVLVVPRGLRHCPRTKDGMECEIMITEMAGVVNTGDAVETNGLRKELGDARGASF